VGYIQRRHYVVGVGGCRFPLAAIYVRHRRRVHHHVRPGCFKGQDKLRLISQVALLVGEFVNRFWRQRRTSWAARDTEDLMAPTKERQAEPATQEPIGTGD